jgi:hypothetical protein
MIKVTSYDWGHEGLITNSDGHLVNGWVSGKANSAGGVSVKFGVVNYGYKAVKSFSVYFTPYNGANEPVRCTTTNTCTKGVSSHDMLSPTSGKGNLIFENAWYNNSIRKVSIEHIDVTYSDGTTETCQGNYIPSSTEEKSWNKERYRGCLPCAIMFGVIFIVILGYFFF